MPLGLSGALVTIADVNLEALVNFYTNLLNQEPYVYLDNIYAEFILPGLRLGIFRPNSTNLAEFDRSERCPISICLEVSNLAVSIDYLTLLGYPPSGEVREADHGREIYAYDPAGNRLILYEKNR